MAAHPSRSGAISAELFAAIAEQLMVYHAAVSEPLDIEPRDFVKHRILDGALEVAMRRARRKFDWPTDYQPALEVDLAGYVHNSAVMRSPTHAGELCGPQRRWIETEISKISHKALAALSQLVPESDHESVDAAAERVRWLNGANANDHEEMD